jgi:hypothetical protein
MKTRTKDEDVRLEMLIRKESVQNSEHTNTMQIFSIIMKSNISIKNKLYFIQALAY